MSSSIWIWEFPKIGDPNTLNSRILIIRTPEQGTLKLGNSHMAILGTGATKVSPMVHADQRTLATHTGVSENRGP